MKILTTYLIIINALGLLFMIADKRRAIKNRYRIPEAVLILVAVSGGSLGSLVGMRLAHHKTRKPMFALGIPIIVLIQIVTLILYIKN